MAREAQVRIKKVLSPDKSVFIMDDQGILVLEKVQNSLTVLGTIELPKFLDSLVSLTPVSTGLLPRNVKLYERMTNSQKHIVHMYVFEFPPSIYPINYFYNDVYAGAVDKTFNLAMPWIQCYVGVKEVGNNQFLNCFSSISCTKTPIIDITDRVYNLPLHNIRNNADICWYDVTVEKSKSETIPAYARKIATTFFASKFNNHLHPHYPEPINVEIETNNPALNPYKNLMKWQELSKDDPDFILQCEFEGFRDITCFNDIVNLMKKKANNDRV